MTETAITTSSRPRSAFRGILLTEARGQFRSGMSALYLGMPLFWILIARLMPPETRPLVVLIGAYSDPVMIGEIFTGAFLARERDQGLLEAWAVSPLGAGTWLSARVLLIGLQGSLGGLILALGAGVPFNPLLFVPGMFLAAASGALIGLLLARNFNDILAFFVLGGIAAALISAPIAAYLIRPSILWMIPGPAVSGWAVLSSSFGIATDGTAVTPSLALIIQFAWTILLFFLTTRVFHRTFFRRPGYGEDS